MLGFKRKQNERRNLIMHTAFLMLLIGLFAGTMGAILGIGGGMIITPIITLGMGLPIKYAIGASIIAVIATSSGSTIAFLKDDVQGRPQPERGGAALLQPHRRP